MYLKRSMILIAVLLLLSAGACAAPPTPVPPAPTGAPGSTSAPTSASTSAPTAAPTAAAPDKVAAAWVAITGNQSPAWIAKEGGIFSKYNLAVDLSFVQGSQPATSALVSGSLDVVQMAGPSAVTAANQGADVVLIAGFLNTSVFKLMADPSLKTMSDLKGKTIAITKFGSSDEFVLRKVLKDNGFEPGKDVQITTSGDASGQIAALKAKLVQAILVSPPNDVTAQKQGAVQLLDTIPLKLPYQAVGLASTRRYIQAHRATVLNFIRAETDALRRFKSDRAFAESVMAKYLQTNDQEVLDASWEAYSKAFVEIPYPSLPGIQEIMDESGITGKKPEDFVDNSLVKELEDSGFFKAAPVAVAPLPTIAVPVFPTATPTKVPPTPTLVPTTLPPVPGDTTNVPLTKIEITPAKGKNISIDLLVVDQENHRLYVADRTTNGVDVFDVSAPTAKYMTTIDLGSGANGVVLASNVKKLFAGLNDSTIAVIDLDPASSKPYQVLARPNTGGKGRADEGDYDPKDKKLYLANSDDGFVTVMDATTNQIITKIDKLGEALEQPRYNPADGMMYMTSSNQNAIYQFDPTKDTLVKKFDVGVPCDPHGLAFNASGKQALLGCSDRKTQQVVSWDVAAGKVLDTFKQTGAGDGLMYDPKVDKFFFGAGNYYRGGQMSIFSGSPIKFLTNVPTAVKSNGVAFDETNNVVYTQDPLPGEAALFSFPLPVLK
ncbi:MAG TPA: ABC transporter substrate-binding protein [Anaerolineae bacterium]